MNSDTPLNRRAVREAAHWLMRLGATQATDADIHACNQWRADDLENERAWQRAQVLSNTFGVIPRELGLATLTRPPSTSRRATLKALTTLCVVSPVAWATWNSSAAVHWRADYHTDAGEQREWVLDDGSRLWANTASAVDQHLSDDAHLLCLHEGEIFVHTSNRRTPPLRIQTRLGMIQAGSFSQISVRLGPQHCMVDVLTGYANIQPANVNSTHIRLSAAQHTTFDQHAAHPPQTSTAGAPEWLSGTLTADAMRLDDFIAELARYRPGVIRCDPSIAPLRLSGTFQLDNTDGVLRALPALLPVKVEYRTSYWVTIKPSHTPA